MQGWEPTYPRERLLGCIFTVVLMLGYIPNQQSLTSIQFDPLRVMCQFCDCKIHNAIHGFRIYGPRFCPDKVDHTAEMTIYPKNVVLKSD